MFPSLEGGVMKRWMVLGLMMMLAGPALADPTADARGVEEAFARACGAGDLKGVMALYADDAIAVWPGQGAEAKGKADIEKMAAALCKEPGGAQFALKSLEALPLGDAHIVTVAHWESTLAGPGRRRLTTVVRSTEVLVKQDGVEPDLPLGRTGADGEPVSPRVEREREDDPAAEDRGPRRGNGGDGPLVGVHLGATVGRDLEHEAGRAIHVLGAREADASRDGAEAPAVDVALALRRGARVERDRRVGDQVARGRHRRALGEHLPVEEEVRVASPEEPVEVGDAIVEVRDPWVCRQPRLGEGILAVVGIELAVEARGREERDVRLAALEQVQVEPVRR